MDNKVSDESDRGDNPSASKMAAIELCRGHHQANQLFPWYGERSAANEGTIRHETEELETPIDEIEDNEQRICAIRCRQAMTWCRESLSLEGGSGEYPDHESEIIREIRLWWDDLWSGQLDYLEIYGDEAFAADYKMLRGEHDPANRNVQLLAQACLVAKCYPKVKSVNVALIEPFQEPTYTTASYSREYLMAEGERLTGVVREALGENPPRVAGPAQCKWCSALPFCPEVRATMKELTEKIA